MTTGNLGWALALWGVHEHVNVWGAGLHGSCSNKKERAWSAKNATRQRHDNHAIVACKFMPNPSMYTSTHVLPIAPSLAGLL